MNNTVYFEALSIKTSDPIDSFVGELCVYNEKECESIGKTIKPQHEGRGKFEFVPKEGKQYGVKVTKPSDITTIYPLPRISNTGALLHSSKDIYNDNEPIELDVYFNSELLSNSSIEFSVKLFKRELEIASSNLTFQKQGNLAKSTVTLTPPLSKYGVLRATLFFNHIPIAERLLFRESQQKLHIDIQTTELEYTPGSTVTVQIKTTDQQGSPISALVGVSVTDETVLNMVDKRKRVPTLPALVLLENEVNRFENANEFLSNNTNIDLLLGTQGWRR